MFRDLVKPLVLAGVLLTLAESVSAGPGSMFYCCTDANGKYVCGDILPQSCYGRGYRELGANGRTLREIGPPLTVEQRAQRAADEETRRQEEISHKEQQLKDQVLLDTYVSLEDIESLRKRALDSARKYINDAEARITEIKGIRKKFEDEAEFYKTKIMPPEIEKGLSNTAFEIRAQESIIESKKKEIVTLEAKYDDDRQRFLELQRKTTSAKKPQNNTIKPQGTIKPQ